MCIIMFTFASIRLTWLRERPINLRIFAYTKWPAATLQTNELITVRHLNGICADASVAFGQHWHIYRHISYASIYMYIYIYTIANIVWSYGSTRTFTHTWTYKYYFSSVLSSLLMALPPLFTAQVNNCISFISRNE